MQSLKIYCLCNRILVNSFSRQFQTYSVLLTRFERKKSKTRIKSQPNIMKALAQEEPQHEEDIEGDEDESEDFNLMEVDAAYDEYVRERKDSKRKLANILTAKKFFEPRKQPQMLTYAERECIKYLHQKDPVQWDVVTLSESFPATPDIIKKVLKSKWHCSPERRKSLDESVQKNWELLAKGNLEGDPELIRHLKKFINRRQAVLDYLNNYDYSPPSPNKVWNMGEMSEIIGSYEKSIQKLIEAQDAEARGSLLPGPKSEEKPVRTRKEESSLKVMHEKINKVASIRNLEGAESFLLKQMINRYQKKVTLEELEQNIINKAEAKKRLNLQEKAILESKMGIHKSEPEKEFQEPSQGAVEERRREDFPKRLLENETTVRVSESIYDEDDSIETSDEKDWSRRKRPPEKFLHPEENLFSIPEPDENTILVNECDLGEKLAERSKLGLVQEKESQKGKKSMRKEKVLDAEAQKRQDLFFEEQVEDIKSTAFWNSRSSSKDKALAELKKGSLGPLKNPEQVSLADVSIVNDYPIRIKIPKSKRGSGLTFKVKDCYYDDDGEFLYRVPGMTK